MEPQGMSLEDIVTIFTFLFGSVLQIAVLFLMAKRKRKKRREIIFALFAASTFLWCFGIFISLFCGYLYRGINIVEQSLGVFAIFSFTLIFPLLVHTLIDFMEQKFLRFSLLVRIFIYIMLYLPTINTFIFIYPLKISLEKPARILQTLENFTSLFLPWAFVLLIAAWYIIVRLCKRTEDYEERRFLGSIGWEITLIICFCFLSFVLEGKDWPVIGTYLVLLTDVLLFLLPPMLAYYLYCYNYIEYVFKRGLIYSMLGIFVIAFYLSVIRPMGAGMEKKFQINFRMVEGLLVMALVFFFDPLKRALHDFLSNLIFFKEQRYYRKVFTDISLMINQATYMDLDILLDYIASTISRAMKIREVSFIFFSRSQDQLEIQDSTVPIQAKDIENIVAFIAHHRLQVLNIYDLGEEETNILREMRRIKAFTIIPIYYENELIGILNVGKRRIRHQLLAEEEEMLIILVNQMVTAIENTRLAREKFTIERRMYETEKLSSLGRLSASIAHEVKNPLSSIKTITQVMKEELPPDDPNQEGLSLIIEEIDRLSRVVKQLLRFARPHSSSLSRVNLSEILNSVLLLLKHEANCNQVTIQNALNDKSLWIISDHDILIEIFFNLIHNSIQALPEGGLVSIDYEVDTSDESDDTSFIHIRIADNGPGIPPEDREKIFEPFYTTKQTGTGLGLTIVRSRIQKIKGKITLAENSPGAVFIVSLPLTIEKEGVEEIEKMSHLRLYK